MKTIKEWLETLPEPYKTQALKNTDEYILRSKEECESIEEVLKIAFVWKYSPEGHNYWEELYCKIKKPE